MRTASRTMQRYDDGMQLEGLETRALLTTWQSGGEWDLWFNTTSRQQVTLGGLVPGQQVRFKAFYEAHAGAPRINPNSGRVWIEPATPADIQVVRQDGPLVTSRARAISGSTAKIDVLFDGQLDGNDRIHVALEKEVLPNLQVAPIKFIPDGVEIGYRITGAEPVDWKGNRVELALYDARWKNGRWEPVGGPLHTQTLDGNPGGWHTTQLNWAQLGPTHVGATHLWAMIDLDPNARTGVIPETTESDNDSAQELPNIAAYTPEFLADGSVRYISEVRTGTAPVASKQIHVSLYWAKGPAESDIPAGSTPISDTVLPPPGGSIAAGSVRVGTVPSWATHVIAVADPARILREWTRSDNVAAAAIPRLSITKFEWNDNGRPEIDFTIAGNFIPNSKIPLRVYGANEDGSRGALFWKTLIPAQAGNNSAVITRKLPKRLPAAMDTLEVVIGEGFVHFNTDDHRMLVAGYKPTVEGKKFSWDQNDWLPGTDPSGAWKLRGSITGDDGLEVHDVRMGQRGVAKSFSLPYYTLRVDDAGPFRLQLLPKGKQSFGRSRLVGFEVGLFDENGGGIGRNDPMIARATYVIDRLGPDSESYLTITQEYRFYQATETAAGFAPTLPPSLIPTVKDLLWRVGTNQVLNALGESFVRIQEAFMQAYALPDNQLQEWFTETFGGAHGDAARFYPEVKYEFHGRDNQTLVRIELPQRLDFQSDGSRQNAAAFIRDSDSMWNDADLVHNLKTLDWNLMAAPGAVFLNDQTSLQKEQEITAVNHGGPASWDNIHITADPAVEPPFNLWRLLDGNSPLPPGAPNAIHIHWRWGKFLEFPRGGAEAGRPDIPLGSNQTVQVGLVRRARSAREADPANWHTLVNGDAVSSRDQVMWYSGIGYQTSDRFFTHGGFVERLHDHDDDHEHPVTAAAAFERAEEFQPEVWVAEGESISIPALTLDPDVNLAALQITLGIPRSGSVSVQGTSVLYRAPVNSSRKTDAFNISVSDDEGTFRSGRVRIHILPATPTGLLASDVYRYAADLRWIDNASNEAAYRIAISTDGVNWDNVGVIAPNSTSFRVTGLLPQRTYYAHIRAANSEGYSEYTDTIQFTTRNALPAAPTDLFTSDVYGRAADLRWIDNATNETAYRIAISTDGANWDNVGVIAANSTSFRITGLQPQSTYYAHIRAANDEGYSPYSNTVRFTTRSVLPAAPTDLFASDVYGRAADLRWIDNASNETAYRIAISTDGVNWDAVGVIAANSTSFRITGLQPQIAYYARIRAANDDGYSAYSNTIQFTTRSVLPATPTGLVTSDVYGRAADLRWIDNASNETAYRIAISTDGVNWDNVGVIAANSTSFRITGLQPQRTYFAHIRAANDEGYSAYSNTVQFTTRNVAPAAPTDLRSGNLWSTAVDLVWLDNSSNETGFTVEKWDSVRHRWSAIGQNAANDHSFRVTGLRGNTLYEFRVLAFNTLGGSEYSNHFSVRTRS